MLAQTFTGDSAVNMLIGLGVSSGFLLALIGLANAWAKSKTAKLKADTERAEADAAKARADMEEANARAEIAKTAAIKARMQAETVVKGIESIADKSVRETAKASITKFSRVVNREGEVDEVVASLGLKKGSKPEIKSPISGDVS